MRAPGLVRFTVTIKETDLMLLARRDLTAETRDAVLTHRHLLERYIGAHPDFLHALEPVDAAPGAPRIVEMMCRAGRGGGVGPMAAVAGAIAEVVGEALRPLSGDLLVENGGDLYLAATTERVVGIYTGEGAIDAALGLRIAPEQTPLGICTSSGRIGHSLSLGEASTATVIAPSASLADAAATAVGNRVRGRGGIAAALEAAREIPGVKGAVVVRGGELGAWGDVELVRPEGHGGREGA